MAEKLKSILRQIHWSLLLKAAVFGGAWSVLPYWAFALVALYLYLVPLFRSRKLAVSFVVLLVLAAINDPSLWTAIFLAVVFYLILGVKNLVFVDRDHSYGILALLILFFASLSFFYGAANWENTAVVFKAAFWGAAAYFIFSAFLRHGVPSAVDVSETDKKFPLAPYSRSVVSIKLSSGLSALLVFELTLVLVFIPLGAVRQSAILFLAIAVILELVSDYTKRQLAAKKILACFSAFLIFAVIILGSAEWGL